MVIKTLAAKTKSFPIYLLLNFLGNGRYQYVDQGIHYFKKKTLIHISACEIREGYIIAAITKFLSSPSPHISVNERYY